MVAPIDQGIQICHCTVVCPHRLIHRRCYCDLCRRGKYHCRENIVGLTMANARNEIGGGGCYEDQVGPTRQFNMAHGGFGIDIQKV